MSGGDGMAHRFRTEDRTSVAFKARQARYRSPEHKAARAHIAVMVAQGRAYCWRPDCGRKLLPGQWHVGHNDDGTAIMGGECKGCNLRAAARKGNRVQKAKRRAAQFVRATR